MSSSYSDLRGDLRLIFPDTTMFPDDRIQRVMDFVIQDIVIKVEMPEFEKTNTTSTLSTGTRSYSISGLDSLAVLTVKDTTSDLVLAPLTLNEAEDWDEDEEGEPAAYFRYGDSLEIYPLPSSDYNGDTLRIRYLERPDVGGPTSTLPGEFDEVLLKGTMYHLYALNGEEEKAAASFRQYQGALNARKEIRAREHMYADRIIYPSQVYFRN